MYPDYLVHFNKNHSKSNGQFVSGDGDGDGIANDHANQKKQLTPEEKKRRAKRNAWIAVGAGAAGTAAVAISMIAQARREKFRDEGDRLGYKIVEKMRQRSYREAAEKAKFVGGDW